MTDERKKTSSWHPDFVVALYENSNSDKLYTMDQMREYADAFHRSRVAASPAAPSPAQTERGAFEWPKLPAFPPAMWTCGIRGGLFTEHQMQGYANAYGEIVRAALQAAPAAEIRDAARYRMARIHAYRFGVANPTPEEFDALCDQHSADTSTTAPVADQSEPVACELCRGIGQIGIPGQRCFNCDGSGKSPHQGLYAPQPAAGAPGMAEPVNAVVLDDERAAIRKAALKDAENLARLFDLGTPDGHAIADDIRKLADAERTVAQPVEQTRALIVEECARFVERGSFLHPEAPPAKFAKECAVAMRSQLLTAARPASGETE